MNLILKLGAGALTAGMAIAAAGCAKSGASTHTSGPATANAKPAHSATPTFSPPQEDNMPRVNVEEARRLIAEGKAVIIDVRGPDSYKVSHIKDALDIPMSKLEAGDIKDLPKDKRIIAYCS
jgi:hypothetical protein